MFKLKLSTYLAVLAAIAVMVLLYGAQKESEKISRSGRLKRLRKMQPFRNVLRINLISTENHDQTSDQNCIFILPKRVGNQSYLRRMVRLGVARLQRQASDLGRYFDGSGWCASAGDQQFFSKPFFRLFRLGAVS
ncbi:hypothetical protein [Pseudomonas cichorii]|uniref:hypothetical protein n=1 Tax=Pseudomonas cichorii TaxID=36746 RepID=UPI000EFF9DA8|nr:hypothetical protein [Pseudomonas cichorii]